MPGYPSIVWAGLFNEYPTGGHLGVSNDVIILYEYPSTDLVYIMSGGHFWGRFTEGGLKS